MSMRKTISRCPATDTRIVDTAGEGGCPCAALGLTEDGGPGSFELAVIRSGSAPGSFTVTHAVV